LTDPSPFPAVVCFADVRTNAWASMTMGARACALNLLNDIRELGGRISWACSCCSLSVSPVLARGLRPDPDTVQNFLDRAAGRRGGRRGRAPDGEHYTERYRGENPLAPSRQKTPPSPWKFFPQVPRSTTNTTTCTTTRDSISTKVRSLSHPPRLHPTESPPPAVFHTLASSVPS
jgi:hypothetical protein